MVNSAATALSSGDLTIDANTGLISVYTANKNTIGTHSVTVKASLMGGYTGVVSTLSIFTITISPCIVTGFTMSTLSPTYDKSYTIADPTLIWSLDGSSLTTQVPACGYI